VNAAVPKAGRALGLVARSSWGWLAERCVAMGIAGAIITATYQGVGRYTSDRHFDLSTSVDAMIPFVPETVWIYFPMFVALITVGTFADRGIFYRTLASALLSALLCTAGFLLLPSTFAIPRLAEDGTLTTSFLRWVQSIDVPNNTFPSQHVALSFAWALGALAYRRWLGLSLLVVAVAVSITTITTKQHYWIDSPAGIAVAILAHWACFRGRRATAPARSA
jgi:membrane-associated phospholipid phosphatase